MLQGEVFSAGQLLNCGFIKSAHLQLFPISIDIGKIQNSLEFLQLFHNLKSICTEFKKTLKNSL